MKKGFLWNARNHRAPQYRTKWYWMDVQEIIALMVAALQVSFVSVGAAVACMDGLPIGGLLSKVMATIMLCPCEQEWLNDQQYRERMGFRGMWDGSAVLLRYVDDVIIASRLWCRS